MFEAELRSRLQNELSKRVLEQAGLEFIKVSRWRRTEAINASKDLTLSNVTAETTEKTRLEMIGAPWYNQIQQLVGVQICTLATRTEELTLAPHIMAHAVSGGSLKVFFGSALTEAYSCNKCGRRRCGMSN